MLPLKISMLGLLAASALVLARSGWTQEPQPTEARVRLLGQVSNPGITGPAPGGLGGRFGGAVPLPPRSPVVVVSRQQRNLLWILAAQGNEPELYATDTLGHDLGTWRLTSAENSEWTALALGRCDRQTCLYIGDLGDSLTLRGSVQLYRFEEPTISADRMVRAYGISRVQRLDVHYPDGRHDARAMTVQPDGAVLIATSGREGRSQLYRVSPDAWLAGRSADARAAGSLNLKVERTGAVSGLGRWSDQYVVRTAAALTLLDLGQGGLTVNANVPACALPHSVSAGLGVDWLDQNRIVVSVSDESGGAARLYAVECPR